MIETILAVVALAVAVIALAQIASQRRENREILEELKALRNAVDAFEAPARGESAASAVDMQADASAVAPAPVAAAAPAVQKVEAPATSEIPEPILAVIAASVAGALRGHYRILAIQAANAAQQVAISVPVVDWSLEGRREIYSSHKLR